MLDDDLEMLIINQVKLQRQVKGLLNNEHSEVDKVVEKLRVLSGNTNELTAELSGESVSSGSSESSLNTSEYGFYVDLVDRSESLQKALEVSRVWSNLSNENKELTLINMITDARLKRVHDSFMKLCKETGQPLKSELLDLLKWFVFLLNLSRIDAHKVSLFEPIIGDYYRGETMQSLDEVISGKVKEVLLPAILKLRIKSLVVVQSN